MDHLDLRRQIIHHARRLTSLGLTTGISGNLSIRLPRGADGAVGTEGKPPPAGASGPDGMLITPSGIAYEALEPADIVEVRFTGPGSAEWHHPLDASTEWPMHQAVYQARPEAGAVVHGHPTYATVLAIQGLGIGPLHYMVATAGGPDIRCAPYEPYGTHALSRVAVQALEGRKACLLAHHGLLAFERDLERAMWLAAEVETLAQQTVMCMSLGGPRWLSDEQIAVVVDKFSRYGLKTKPAAHADDDADGPAPA